MKQQFTIQAVTACIIEYGGTIEYSIDNGNTWCFLKKLSLPADNEAQFRNAKPKRNDSFMIKGMFNVYGHVSTLAPYGTNAFMWLFYKTHVVDASKLILDFDALWPKAYTCMFADCNSLVSAPVLPATTLAHGCYQCMFIGCTSLTTAPELPAMALADGCYSGMFSSCTSLATAPELPAMTLAKNCYGGMFTGCTSLTTAPELPATTLATECYYAMFSKCTSLETVHELPAAKLEKGCYNHMFKDCENIKELPLIPKQALIDAIRMILLS